MPPIEQIPGEPVLLDLRRVFCGLWVARRVGCLIGGVIAVIGSHPSRKANLCLGLDRSAVDLHVTRVMVSCCYFFNM